jgi:hypothetical protein
LDGGLAIDPNGRITEHTKAYNTPPADIREQAHQEEEWGMRFRAAAENSARPEVAGMLAWSEEEGGGSFFVDGEEVYDITREEIRDRLVDTPIIVVDGSEPAFTVYRGTVSEEEVRRHGEPVTVEYTEREDTDRLHVNDIVQQYAFDEE